MRFPDLPIGIVPVAVDSRLFHFQTQKRLQITLASRKRPLEAAFIQDLFWTCHPEFRSIPWVNLQGTNETQVAAILRDTAVYLALCRFESCPLTILEAMASGCVVAGFTGLGGRQYATDRNGFWADEDDCIEAAERLAQGVRLITEGGPRCSDLLEAGHVTARYYSRERMARSLIDYWKRFLAGLTPSQ